MAAHVHRLAAPCAYAAGSDRKVKVFTLFSGGFPPPARVGIAPVYTSVPPLPPAPATSLGAYRARLRPLPVQGRSLAALRAFRPPQFPHALPARAVAVHTKRLVFVATLARFIVARKRLFNITLYALARTFLDLAPFSNQPIRAITYDVAHSPEAVAHGCYCHKVSASVFHSSSLKSSFAACPQV